MNSCFVMYVYYLKVETIAVLLQSINDSISLYINEQKPSDIYMYTQIFNGVYSSVLKFGWTESDLAKPDT